MNGSATRQCDRARKVEPDKDKARATNAAIMGMIDVVVGNQDDFDDALGFTLQREVGRGAARGRASDADLAWETAPGASES
jgi:hypothetical protein